MWDMGRVKGSWEGVAAFSPVSAPSLLPDHPFLNPSLQPNLLALSSHTPNHFNKRRCTPS
jgi:hypothetical protein